MTAAPDPGPHTLNDSELLRLLVQRFGSPEALAARWIEQDGREATPEAVSKVARWITDRAAATADGDFPSTAR